MARPNKQKISTQAEVGTGLFQAFAGLQNHDFPAGEEVAPPQQPLPSPARLGRVVIRRETAHRGGKTVTIIDDFSDTHRQDFIEDLAKKLRTHCGCGGSAKQKTIELQGEQAAKAREYLQQLGFKVAGIR